MDIFRGQGVEIKLAKRADFLVVKETLTRIGVPGENNVLYQSCHILHKQGRYVIIHHHELNILDGDPVAASTDDLLRRNKIVSLLVEWELLTVVDPNMIEEQAPIGSMKVLNFKEKGEWTLVPKYQFWTKDKS